MRRCKQWILDSFLFGVVIVGITSCQQSFAQDIHVHNQTDTYVLTCQPNERILISFPKGRNIPCTDKQECFSDD